VVDVNCKSIEKVEEADYDSKEHCSSLGLTDFFKPIEYVKSEVGGAFGKIKNEIRLSVYTAKEALKKPETRKLWLINHVVKNIPEIITAGYLISYGIANYLYYQDPKLANLASKGLATEGSYTNFAGGKISLDVVKPWIAPPTNRIPTDYFGHVSENHVRPLTILEDDKVGVSLGFIPAAAKYVWKGVRHLARASDREWSIE
jgi:hypothetical protein